MRALLVANAAALLHAASSTAWEMNTFQDFSKARFENCSLSRDGRVTLAPKLDLLFSSEQTVVWSVAQAPNGDTYLGTGHKGRLYRVDKAGRGELVWQSGEAEIFAVAVDLAGRVFAATSPNGKIYRLESGGKAQEYFNPGAKFIWSMAAGKDGMLYAATGDEGKVFRVTAQGRGEVYYETGQTHATSLALDLQGRVLVGTEPNGILYRVSAKDKAFVLHDANFAEIRAIVAAADGTVYAAAMGGSAAKQATAATAQTGQTAGTTPSVTTTITVTDTDAAAQGGTDIKPKPPQQTQQQQQQQATATTATTATVDYPGVERSAIFKILPDNTVEQIWVSKEENAYDIAQAGAAIYIATDNQGRVYRLDSDRKVTLVSETRENEVTRMLPQSTGVLMATGELGKLFRLGDSTAAAGSIESPVHDATTVARWGRLSWRADSCRGCGLTFRTRTGNSARPDKTWSEWSDPAVDPSGTPIASPNARYVQWKAEIRGGGADSPVLDSVRLAYLPQNAAPLMKSVTVSAQVAAAPAAKPAVTSPTAAYSVTVTDTGDASATSATGTLTQPITRAANEQIVISWVAEDSDGDRLTYSLHFRGEGDAQWRPLKLNFGEAAHVLDAEAFADGRYWFRVTVSDRVANAPGQAREAEMASAPVLVDRTPPSITLGPPVGNANALEIRADVRDTGSPLKGAEYSVDAGPWTPLAALDGVTDSPNESFLIRLDPAPAGSHMLVVRAYDSGNNAGVAKIAIQ